MHEQTKEKYDKRAAESPMRRDYVIQMTMMMVMANLYNSSPGRSTQSAAKTAYDAGVAVWEQWLKGG